jgi:acyl carrier protein
MQSTTRLKAQIRQLLVEDLMLKVKPEEIGDELPLFGEGLGLDSVDALQLVVALDKTFGLKIADPQMAKAILKNLTTIVAAVERHQNQTRSGDHSKPD